MGHHEEAREATKRAIKLNPDARAGPGQPRARALRHDGAAARTAERPQIVEGGSARALQSRSRVPAEGPARRGAARVPPGARRRRRPPVDAAGDGGGRTCCGRELPAALELYDALVRDYADSPKLWNERGVCLHQAGRRADAIASYEHAVAVDAGYQLAWNNLGVIAASEAGDGRDRGLPARAGGRAATPRRPAQPRPAPVPAAASAPGGAGRVPGRARRAERRAPSRGTAWARAHGAPAVRGRPQRLRPRGGRRLRHGRRALQPELRPEPAGRLRRRPPRDPTRARARAALCPAEVLAHHRPAVRRSDDRDRARAHGRGGRRRAGRGVRLRSAGAGSALRRAGAGGPGRRPRTARAATRWISRATTSRRACWTSPPPS